MAPEVKMDDENMAAARRDFLKKSTAAAALAAMGLCPSTSAVRAAERRGHGATWMKLSLAYFYGGVDGRPQRMSLAKQMGVLGGVGGGGRDVGATKRAYEEHGLEWTVLEGVNLTRAQLGVEGREEDIERFIRLMQDCADAGVDTICYNWMPAVSWSRTDMARTDRGGSLVTAFDLDAADLTPTEFGDELRTRIYGKTWSTFSMPWSRRRSVWESRWLCTRTIRPWTVCEELHGLLRRSTPSNV